MKTNLAEDIGETQDRSANHPEIRDVLLAAWSQWREPFPPRANPGVRKKPTQATDKNADGKAVTLNGVFSAIEMKNPAGESYMAYTVTTAGGSEYLIYYRLLKDKLAGRKPAEFTGRKVRVAGVYNQTARGGTFIRLDCIELDSEV